MRKVSKRLPTLKEKYIHKASSYYMNNRKLFVEKINQLLTPYIKELENLVIRTKKIMNCYIKKLLRLFK